MRSGKEEDVDLGGARQIRREFGTQTKPDRGHETAVRDGRLELDPHVSSFIHRDPVLGHHVQLFERVGVFGVTDVAHEVC